MTRELEERLHQYGATFEHAIRTGISRKDARPPRVRLARWRHPVVAAIVAAIVVATVATSVVLLSVHDRDAGNQRPASTTPPRSQATFTLGIHEVWPGPELAGMDRSGPAATAETFVRDVVGEAAAQVTPDAAPPDGPTWVSVKLSNGTSFKVLCVPTSDRGWVVLQAGAPRFTYALPSALRLDSTVAVREGDAPPTTAARILSPGQAAWRDGAGVHVKDFSREDAERGQIPIDVSGTLYSAVIVFRKDAGGVVDVAGVHFRS